tara:strand:- start:80 stop:514 length:435 start_codon:yes stop_codon:yes gene_type:complete
MIMIQSRNAAFSPKTIVAAFMLALAVLGVSAPAQAEEGAQKEESRAQQLMGDVTPKLADLTDDVLYGDVWERGELSKRDRSLVTVSVLIAINRPEQLRSHLGLALKNGVTKEELAETITHSAFYTGWPNAVNAALIAKEVFKEH